jgi:serine/threonine protein phosphatase PrpC
VTNAVRPFRAAGLTDVGAQRVVNEDRFFADAGRGIFIVIDGVGGQAAGGAPRTRHSRSCARSWRRESGRGHRGA